MIPPIKKIVPRDMLAIAAMWIALIAVIWPPVIKPGTAQVAADYLTLHQWRMMFARQALLGPTHILPAWYPRELLGTPFRANVQNFPFLPTRLLILLLLDPRSPYTFAIAVGLAAILTSLFTFLYCRRIGLGMVGSATAGWTFATSGYFVSRIAAGHLPLLEVFWGLPLLLWIIESLVQRQNKNQPIAGWLCALALSCTALSLAGHPQLPFYAMVCTAFYVIARNGLRQSARPLIAMALGVGCAGFALVPMSMLIARSTRILPLAAAGNDLALPYSRLVAFFLPWADGAPSPLDRAGFPTFFGYPAASYFWDTVCYVGWLPWLALVALLWWSNVKKPALDQNVRRFLIAIGVLGIVLALPFVKSITSFVPGTLLRSPVRLLYLTEFSLAIALACLVDRIIRAAPRRIASILVPLILLVQFADLGWHDHYFIQVEPTQTPAQSAHIATLLQSVGDGRAAMDLNILTYANRSVDDVGFFDSIVLAKPYRWLFAIAGAPADMNTQMMVGSHLPARALAAAGVKLVITYVMRPDLRSLEVMEPLHVYAVDSPAPRAEFYDLEHVKYLKLDQIHAALRNPRNDSVNTLWLPKDSQHPAEAKITNTPELPVVKYNRPDSDHIQCTVETPQAGFVRILESWDPGWSATVDGATAPVLAAMDALLAVPVSPGSHQIKLSYATPGAFAGICVSAVFAILLILFIIFYAGDSLPG